MDVWSVRSRVHHENHENKGLEVGRGVPSSGRCEGLSLCVIDGEFVLLEGDISMFHA